MEHYTASTDTDLSSDPDDPENDIIQMTDDTIQVTDDIIQGTDDTIQVTDDTRKEQTGFTLVNHNKSSNPYDQKRRDNRRLGCVYYNGNKRNYKRANRFYCSNCGCYGHVFKRCRKPVTSLGIIAIRKSELDNIESDNIMKLLTLAPTDNVTYGNIQYCESYNQLIELNKEPEIKYLLVRRKDSIGYINIIRGRYETLDILKIYFDDMTALERTKIEDVQKNPDKFDELWDELWVNHSSKCYLEEKEKARDLFFKLDIKSLLETSNVKWTYPEWGIPKGRRHRNESNIDTAIREFTEETGYAKNDIEILNLEPIDEELEGTDSIKYLHRYYIAIVKKSAHVPFINKNNVLQVGEIGDIGWFTYNECLELFRNRHKEKKGVLTKVNNYIVETVFRPKL